MKTENLGKPFNFETSNDDLVPAIENNMPELKDYIVHIWAEVAGHNDEDHWFWIVEAKDGTILSLDGWCDYTGWDCQSSLTILGRCETLESSLDCFNIVVRENLAKQLRGENPFGLEIAGDINNENL